MSAEWGIFTDEGKVEGDFYSRESADACFAKLTADDDDRAACESENMHVGECCHDHPENEKDNCEDCNAEESEDEIDE